MEKTKEDKIAAVEHDHALDAIDGYWMTPLNRTEKNMREAFEFAKAENILHRTRMIERIAECTFEQFAEWKGACWLGIIEP